MIPVIAIVGRPNVGKSTLFNCITKSRDALVADQPGLTRDRKYGDGKIGDRPYIVVDTGGLVGDEEGVEIAMAKQVWQAVDEADLVFFVVDARAGLTAVDAELADKLRKSHKPIFLLANKIDGIDENEAMADFYELGLGEPTPIAAAHGRGVTTLVENVLAELPDSDEDVLTEKSGIKIAFIGRPNVGKSTLVNRILGEERVVVYDQAGTTRDSIFVPFNRRGKDYILIDTAGIRRRGKVTQGIEKFSVIKALQAVDASNVVVLVIDAHEEIAEQDLRLLGYILDAGRSLVIAINKWDNMLPHERDQIKKELDRRLSFIDYAKIHFISALHGTGVGDIFKSINQAYKAATKEITTAKINAALEQIVSKHEPPLIRGRRIKLRYAHMGGHNPPIIVIHGNQTKDLPSSYKKYLEKAFRKEFNLIGTPLRLEFQTGANPYAGRKNKLTPRQIHKRKRLIRHVNR